MTDYHIYLLDLDGLIERRVDAVCNSDEEVTAFVKEILNRGRTAEVWESARLLGRVTSLRMLPKSKPT
jgi:hypothetical protein